VRRLAALGAAAFLSACASDKVTLLADEAGAPQGAVAVFDPKSGAEVGTLSAANTAASLGGRAVRAQPADPSAHAALLSALPPPPRHFRLYFIEGTTTLTEASKPTFRQLQALVTPGSYVQIIGYTDTVGSGSDNQRLSEARASEIKRALVALGLPIQDAVTTGRGEHDLARPTADNVAEPLNRRVEVILR
jgi:outer membrane protein OmpA-like peptidoglycan-associated protein